MSKNYSKFLKSHLSFDDLKERKTLWDNNRFAAMRKVWELFNRNLGKYVMLSEYASIDDTLYPMRHQIAFRQHNPNKLHRYGLLLKSLNDARFP